ncbi:MAG: FxLYD domain-containing protein [Cyanobacteria bacterium J06642_11]
MDRERIIEAYIQRLLTWEKPLDKGTLAAISKEVGITPAEMHAIKRQAMAHFTRGRNYLQFDCLNDAIDELTQAMALDPLNLDLLHALANAYNQRYNREEDAADRQKALVVAKRCVELKPNDKEALVLISFLEHTPSQKQGSSWQWTKQKLAIAGGGVAIISMGLLGVSRLPVFSTPAPLGPAPGTIVPGSVIYEANDDDLLPDTPDVDVPAAADLISDVDIPVSFDYPGIVLEARLSQLVDYEDAVYHQLHGVFVNASDKEIRKLTLNTEFLDDNNVAIATNGKDAIGPKDATIRPGDTHAFSWLQKVTSDLTTVNLSITSLEQVPSRRTYVPPTPINYGWQTIKPDNISFELASRSEYAAKATATTDKPEDTDSGSANTDEAAAAQPRAAATSPNGNFNAEWVIINTSNYPLQELKLTTAFYDGNNRQLQTEEVVAISKNDAPLLPGEIRPFRVIKSVASSYERYQVTVLEAE